VLEILDKNNLYAISIIKLPRSGQRQVFEITFGNGKASILKFVDVTPYGVFERLEWFDDFSEEEFQQEHAYEIEVNSKRIVRELDAAKKCTILPQLEVLDEYKIYIKDKHQFIYYFETKFQGKTLSQSELYHQEQGIDTIIDFLLQMVKQIKVMYDSGYVHRDLTPRNIIYLHGQFKIIDAGLVKSNEEEKLTATRATIGTPYYMAPEQAKRTSEYVWDFRTDLFPLGIIAIEMFLPNTRHFSSEQIRDMHRVFPLWQGKDSSTKSMIVFGKLVARLAAEQRYKRWSDLSELIHSLETLTVKEESK